MRPRQLLVSVTALVALSFGLMACGEEAVDTKPATPQATVTVTNEAAPESEPTEETKASEELVGANDASGGDTFTMPDETGKTLQAAQDDLQAVSGSPLFYSGSEDATGADRGQWNDSGWQVCSQHPAAGTEVRDDEDDVMFYVVRVSEDCP